MTRTRLHRTESTTRTRNPTTPEGCVALLDRAISLASERQDRRLGGLVKARADGRARQVLTQLGIISEACLQREFPEPTPSE